MIPPFSHARGMAGEGFLRFGGECARGRRGAERSGAAGGGGRSPTKPPREGRRLRAVVPAGAVHLRREEDYGIIGQKPLKKGVAVCQRK